MTLLPQRVGRLAVVTALALGGGSMTARAADTVEIYSAGSLRNAVAELVKRAAPDIEIKPTFGGSGLLRERIEGGEHPDLFLSADLGSPHKLASAGRTVVPVVAFARNRMCLVARKSAGVTPANLVDKLLASDQRLKTSTPIADPAGDYAMAIFDRIEAARPGSGRILRDKAQRLMGIKFTAVSGHSAVAPLFTDNQIDMMITYCSGAPALEKEVPDVATLPFPPELDPNPVYGLALLSTKPAAMRVALLLLSDDGQAIIARAGLLPILETAH